MGATDSERMRVVHVEQASTLIFSQVFLTIQTTKKRKALDRHTTVERFNNALQERNFTTNQPPLRNSKRLAKIPITLLLLQHITQIFILPPSRFQIKH